MVVVMMMAIKREAGFSHAFTHGLASDGAHAALNGQSHIILGRAALKSRFACGIRGRPAVSRSHVRQTQSLVVKTVAVSARVRVEKIRVVSLLVFILRSFVRAKTRIGEDYGASTEVVSI